MTRGVSKVGDDLGEALQHTLDARISSEPGMPDLSQVTRRGVARRRSRRAGAAAAAVVVVAVGALTIPRLDLFSRVQEPGPSSVAAGVKKIGRMSLPRAAHAATLLADGKILISGGFSGNTEVYYDSTEIFDPSTRTFTASTPMNTPRTGHVGVLLEDGKVLIAGGWGNGFLDTAELYDSTTGRFAATGSMHANRDGFTATRLQDGRVLVVGGFRHSYESFNDSAEIYDPSTGIFTPTGSLQERRASHTATLLPNGKVVIAGGLGPQGVLRSIEVFNPTSGRFRLVGNMITARQKHGAVLLDNGKVLFVGGADINDFDGLIQSAEIYNPAKRATHSAALLREARYKLPSPINLPNSHRVFVVGGADTAELYKERAMSFGKVSGRFEGAQSFPTATLLQDGSVLVAGGYDQDVVATDQAWLFIPGIDHPGE